MDRVGRQDRLRIYERVLETVDDMVCVLDGERVSYATTPLASWLDTTREELVGRPLVDVLPPDAAEALREALDSLDKDGEVTVDLAVDRTDGSTRRGVLRLSPLPAQPGQTVGSLDDTTELVRARTALGHERDRFLRLFEQIPDPILEVEYVEDDTVVRSINDAFAERFGHDPTAIEGRSIRHLDLHYGTDVDADGRSIDERVREGGVLTDQFRRRTVDGPREFLFRGFTYESGSKTRAFGIYTDITEQKHRERYLQVTNRILRHNLRNELNVVFGYASEIVRLAEDDVAVEYARRIEQTGRELAGLAEGAAELKQYIDGGAAIELGPVPLKPMAERVAADLRDRYPTARIDVDVPASATAHADEDLETAIEELVENAIEHGGETPRVLVEATVDGQDDGSGEVSLVVADDGPGIPDSIRTVVAGEGEITQLQHNSGIGLWLVSWIVGAYGGDLSFGPGIDGTGTAVTMRIPAAD